LSFFQPGSNLILQFQLFSFSFLYQDILCFFQAGKSLKKKKKKLDMSKKLNTSSSLELKLKGRTWPTSSIAPEALNNQIPELNVPWEGILALLTY